MNARDELLLLDGSDEWPAKVDAILARHRAEVLIEAADAIVTENDRKLWASKPGRHWAADLLRHMAASPAAAPVPDETGDLTSRLYDALASYPALTPVSLRHAQIRQDLAEHLADALTAQAGDQS